jgi:transcriptional regulator with XRE-family HTH domain
MKLSEHIRELRETYYKENQGDFASRLGKTRVTATRWENGIEPKRPVLKALLGMADEVGYLDGVKAFAAAIGPTYSQPEGLLDLATRVYGSWSALQGVMTFTDQEAGEHFASGVNSGLRELIDKLRRSQE